MAQDIFKKIDEVKGRIKKVEMTALAFAFLTFAIVLLCAEIILDRLFTLDATTRAVIFFVFAAIACIACIIWLLLLLKRISNLYAARVIETHYPKLKEAIITFLEFAGEKKFAKMMEKRIYPQLTSCDTSKVVSDRAKKLFMSTLCIVCIFVIITAVTAGEGFFVYFKRAILFFEDISPPTKTTIIDVKPGNLIVMRGKNVEITVSLEGQSPGKVLVYLTYDNEQWYNMYLEQEGIMGMRYSGTIYKVKDSFSYFILAGDARSKIYQIKVMPPPTFLQTIITVTPPSYTGASKYTVSETSFDVLKNSLICFEGISDRILKSAWMVFIDGRQRLLSRLSETHVKGFFYVHSPTQFMVVIIDKFGFRCALPVIYRIGLKKDMPPEVGIVYPSEEIHLFPDECLIMRASVLDDYGIEKVVFAYKVKGRKEKFIDLPIPKEGLVDVKFSLTDLGLKAGDVMLYYVMAKDRCPWRKEFSYSRFNLLHVVEKPSEYSIDMTEVARNIQNLFKDKDILKKLPWIKEYEKEFKSTKRRRGTDVGEEKPEPGGQENGTKGMQEGKKGGGRKGKGAGSGRGSGTGGADKGKGTGKGPGQGKPTLRSPGEGIGKSPGGGDVKDRKVTLGRGADRGRGMRFKKMYEIAKDLLKKYKEGKITKDVLKKMGFPPKKLKRIVRRLRKMAEDELISKVGKFRKKEPKIIRAKDSTRFKADIKITPEKLEQFRIQIDLLKERVDPEFRKLLEEYYKSLSEAVEGK